MIKILGLLGKYFNAVVIEVKTFLLLFRLALAILCEACVNCGTHKLHNQNLVTMRVLLSF